MKNTKEVKSDIYEDLIRRAIDMHVHVGPEIIPRKYTIRELVAAETGRLKGAVVKNHFYSTVGMDKGETAQSFTVVDSVTLNRYVGGFNPYAIEATAALSKGPFVVWFPTIHARNFLDRSEYEIPPEWLSSEVGKRVPVRKASEVRGLSVLDGEGKIRGEVKNVLETIRDTGAILATGHISWRESAVLLPYALKEVGVEKVIVTHPIYGRIAMPIGLQVELAAAGAYIEECFSMYSIDGIPMERIVEDIRTIGASACIFSSDVGQAFSKAPSEALREGLQSLACAGLPQEDLEKLVVFGPKNLLL